MTASAIEIDHFTFIWNIDNIALNPLLPNKMLCSPTFNIEGLGFTKWSIVLYPRGTSNKEHVSLYLRRDYGSSSLTDIAINFKFSLDSTVPRFRFETYCRNITFRENQYWGYTKFARIDYLAAIISTSCARTLTVRCDISPSDEQKVNLTRSITMDLKVLSENIKTSYGSECLFDVILRSNSTNFNVHKAIISARSPKFAQSLGFNDVSTESDYVKDVSYISTPVLRTLLFFLYSGELDLPVSAIPRELFVIAEQYELTELIQKMCSFPQICYARTYMNVERKSINWEVRNICSLTGEISPFVHVIPMTKIYIRNLIIWCNIETSEDGCTQHMNVSIRPTGIVKEKPIFVKCRIGFDIQGGIAHGFDGNHLFEHDEEWKFFPALKLEQFNFVTVNVNRLVFEFDLCDGISLSAIESSWTSTEGCAKHFHDYSKLSSDLGELLTDKMFSDVSIICADQTFKAHKVILAARSPVFRRMFERNVVENEIGLFDILGVRPEIMKLMLAYMYSGTIEDWSYESTRDLYELANKYEISVLKEKCSALLMRHMNTQNADEIETLADRHYDKCLKERAVQFIWSNTVIEKVEGSCRRKMIF